MRGLGTETVTVLTRRLTGTDEYGNDTYAYGGAMTLTWADALGETWEPDGSTWADEAPAGTDGSRVAGVVVRPATSDEADQERVGGTSASYTLYFPRGTDLDLRGALIEVRGRTFEVVGDPQRYPEGRLVKYDLVAEARRHDG